MGSAVVSASEPADPLASLSSDQTALLTAATLAAAGRPEPDAEDPLTGVLDAIAGLLPSQSELDQLMEGSEPTPAPPVAPVGEARIDPATCQVNLLNHLMQMQLALQQRLDTVEQHLTALEKVADLDASWGGEQPGGSARQLLQTVLRDVQLVERMAQTS
ncbi:uncharacterized protein LOC119096706 [Pollicipes pollicipes]|uniref:uncharacterized protein LOC119096706 n=1 Tax=Pollicipes pollicipes TaxID=41117 RepID=UPI0018858094|nr:uncharacterized protein LOC119096706 [Pollicipes pollicipes]